ncbi:hypothetical protein [Amycolatopsis taiwanensis]|uniref:hypothetical protein n=1 Tax=Amycolatopsis taiwanensis TaxID=342230 RepID=UPI0004B93ECC|nr:hypothetical protein [Amycolatopsis taiwanensis]
MAKCTSKVPIKQDGRIKRDPDGKAITRPCKAEAIRGGKVCRMHGGNAKQVKAKAAVRAEVMAWGLGNTTVDPAETLLKLLSQSAARAEHYSRLLADAYDAAERLKTAHDAHQLLTTGRGDSGDEDTEPAAVQQARGDLDRIFTTGGVAALVGNTYSASNNGSVYATGEAIRGLAQLEATERDRCARFAKLALDAGIAERQVRLAERQGALIEQVLTSVFADLGLTDQQLKEAPAALRRALHAVA